MSASSTILLNKPAIVEIICIICAPQMIRHFSLHFPLIHLDPEQIGWPSTEKGWREHPNPLKEKG
jgi:hypothetical protein